MPDYNSDKRLDQDRIERANKTNASIGMFIGILIIIVAIIIGFYLYYRPTQPVQETSTATMTNYPSTQQTVPAPNTSNYSQ